MEANLADVYLLIDHMLNLQSEQRTNSSEILMNKQPYDHSRVIKPMPNNRFISLMVNFNSSFSYCTIHHFL